MTMVEINQVTCNKMAMKMLKWISTKIVEDVEMEVPSSDNGISGTSSSETSDHYIDRSMNTEQHQRNSQVTPNKDFVTNKLNCTIRTTLVRWCSDHNLSIVPVASISIVFLLTMPVREVDPDHEEVLMKCYQLRNLFNSC
uniref:Uncharacterized protein n=1 Tax=Peronospora matthiolae TaxID=2874970 RepID=A0AAV1TF52_9STRA